MEQRKTSPLQAGFWLSAEEKRYILVVCAIFLIGLAARYFYLKNQTPDVYTPADIEQTEPNHE